MIDSKMPTLTTALVCRDVVDHEDDGCPTLVKVIDGLGFDGRPPDGGVEFYVFLRFTPGSAPAALRTVTVRGIMPSGKQLTLHEQSFPFAPRLGGAPYYALKLRPTFEEAGHHAFEVWVGEALLTKVPFSVEFAAQAA